MSCKVQFICFLWWSFEDLGTCLNEGQALHWLWSLMWNGCCLVKHSKTLLVSTTTADAVFDWCTHWWCFTWCATNNKNAVMSTSWPCRFDQWRVHVASFDFVTNSLPGWRTEESMNQIGWQTDRQTDKAAAGYEIRNAATIKVVLDDKLRAVLYFYMDRVQCCWKRRKNIKKNKKNLKLQPYLDFWVSEVKMDSLLLPSLYCYGVSLSPCVLLPFSVSFLVHSTHFTSLTPPLTLPHFPYFGMLMCYLLTLCMNDNMYVYSYNRVPFSRCWLKMVWMLYRFRFSVHLLLYFCSISNVCRA